LGTTAGETGRACNVASVPRLIPITWRARADRSDPICYLRSVKTNRLHSRVPRLSYVQRSGLLVFLLRPASCVSGTNTL
jgi:hypothetical protein